MEQKYGALRIVSSLTQFLGWIIIICGVIGAAPLLQGGAIGFALMTVVGGLFFGLMTIASGQLFYVFMDIETNTRKSSENIHKRNNEQKEVAPRTPAVTRSIKIDPPQNADATCPNCSSLINVNTNECWKCAALFGGESSWKPNLLKK